MENADHPDTGSHSTDGVARRPAHLLLFGWIISFIFVTDQLTKLLAVDLLAPAYVPRPVFGDLLRLTLVYNPGAAFGLHLGEYSRWIFTALTIGALALLYRLYRETQLGDVRRVVAIALVAGGALGNLLDRLRSARGVVDFIDVGINATRWPTFNVADMAVSCGAVLLAIVLWREDTARARRLNEAPSGPDAPADAPVHS